MVLVKPCTKQRRLHLNATAGRCDGTRQPSQTINYSIVLALGRMRTHTNYKSEVCGATIRGEPKLGQNYLETGEKRGGLETSRPVRVFSEWIVLIFIFAFAHLS